MTMIPNLYFNNLYQNPLKAVLNLNLIEKTEVKSTLINVKTVWLE